MWGCGLRFGMDSSKFGGIRCEIRVRKCCLSVNTFNLQLLTSYLIKARRVWDFIHKEFIRFCFLLVSSLPYFIFMKFQYYKSLDYKKSMCNLRFWRGFCSTLLLGTNPSFSGTSFAQCCPIFKHAFQDFLAWFLSNFINWTNSQSLRSFWVRFLPYYKKSSCNKNFNKYLTYPQTKINCN